VKTTCAHCAKAFQPAANSSSQGDCNAIGIKVARASRPWSRGHWKRPIVGCDGGWIV